MTDIGSPIGKIFGGIVEATAFATENAVNSTVIGATKATGSKIGQDVRLIAKAWQKGYLDFDERVAMHRRVAKFAQNAMLASYDKNLRGSANRTPNTRFARGRLRKALANRAFYEATPDGVIFGRASYLDRVAKQWYRMNFGVGERGSETPPAGNHVIQLFTRTGTVLSVAGFGPASEATPLPAGIFMTPGGAFRKHSLNRVGQDSFNIFNAGSEIFKAETDNRRRRVGAKGIRSRGHAGIQYLDAGVEALAKAFGLEWTAFSLKVFDEAATQNSGPIAQFLTQDEAIESNRGIRRRVGQIQESLAEYLTSLAIIRGEK